MAKNKKISIGKQLITVRLSANENDYISLTDMPRYKNPLEPKDVVKNWMRNYSTIEFLGIWERINNAHFKGVEFDSFKKSAGANSFTLSPQLWIERTGAIGIISRSGNGGGTFAHKDIAFEFATWISAEFKLYLIKEFQRLKIEENETISSKTFRGLFNIILTGSKDTSRKAAREVKKLLYSSSRDSGKYKDIKNIIDNAPKEYVNIAEDWRQENFVVAVSVLYFLHNKESQPDCLFLWLFHLLQHKNGNIRQSAVRMIKNELGPLTVHIRCPEYKQKKSKSEQSNSILLNLFISLNNLLVDLWKPKYKKYKYIDSLPTGLYKSIQMVLGEMEDDCGEAYIKRLKDRCIKSISPAEQSFKK